MLVAMLKRGDKGTPVLILQRQLLGLGYPLPRWGVDGDLGEETLVAFSLFMRDHAAEADDDREVISDEELALLAEVLSKPSHRRPVKLHDIRQQSNRNNDRGPRSWKEIDMIVLHQTACLLAENSGRMLNIGAHFVTGRESDVWWVHPIERIVYHANGFNRRAVGIEMNGLYAGIEGNLATVWDDPTTAHREKPNLITQGLIDGTKQTIRFIVDEVAKHGGKIKMICAHRQASGTRQNDPGSGLWQAVGMDMIAELGLTDGGRGYCLKDGRGGRPIPEAWNPAYKGIPY